MKLKSFTLSLVVAFSQLLFGVYQTQLKAGDGDCYNTYSWYPHNTYCKDNCTDGSGSCLSSSQKQYDRVKLWRCLPNQASGFTSCSTDPAEVVGIRWKCDAEYNTKALILCATSVLTCGAGVIGAALASGGVALVVGMIGAAGGGVGTVVGCSWCSVHDCMVSKFDPGQEIKMAKSVTTGGLCPPQ
jgi:hypothetical protein